MGALLDELTRKYDAYVDTFRAADGRLPAMMQLKWTHTAFVVRNAEAIADAEGFSPEERETAVVAALLHDTGRYEQLRRYDTFRDSDSVDHAVFSHDIIVREGWPVGEPVLKAVLYHNRRDVPAGLDPLTEKTAHTVRDADKLDIFRVLEDQIAHTDWRTGARAFWNLATKAPPSPAVVACIARGEPVDYQLIATLADFVLIQVGWMISGLRFAASRRLCRDRRHLAFRRDFLHQLTDDPAIDRVCDLAERTFERIDS